MALLRMERHGPLAASLPVARTNIPEHLDDDSHENMVRMVGEGIRPPRSEATTRGWS